MKWLDKLKRKDKDLLVVALVVIVVTTIVLSLFLAGIMVYQWLW